MKITLQELLANIEHRTQLLAEMVQQQKEAAKHWHLSGGMGTKRCASAAPWWYRIYCYLWHQLIGGDGGVQIEAVPLPATTHRWSGTSRWVGWGGPWVNGFIDSLEKKTNNVFFFSMWRVFMNARSCLYLRFLTGFCVLAIPLRQNFNWVEQEANKL